MTNENFNHLMKGETTKWADMGQNQSIKKVMVASGSTSAVRAEIQRHEEPIPEHTMANIQEFIKKLRADGHKEAKIRRIVKNKFHITVV